jgi:hypothetical protein
MQIPAAMFIESAANQIHKLSDFARRDQLKELESFGDSRATQLGASGLSDDFKAGYTLGLQVARTMLATNAQLTIAGIKTDELL